MSCKSASVLTALGVVTLVSAGTLQAAERVDLIVKNAHVLTMDASRTAYEKGVVAVRGDTIVAVGGPGLLGRYQAEIVIDAGGDIAMPGMINLHNHIAMVAFRGLGEDGVENRLFEFFFPLEKEMLSRDLIRVASRQGAIEMALAGVTLVADMYYHEDEVARAVAEVGIRGVLGETVIGFPVVDAAEPWGGLAYAEEFIKEWKGHPLITPAVAPHAPYTVPPEWLLKSKALAEREGVPILFHMAEFAHEERLIREGVGAFPEEKSVVRYLEELGFLSDALLAAHVIYVDEADMAILKRHGVGVSHNPKANSRGATGMSPAWEMFGKGLDIGLGTDGPMGSNQMDIVNVLGYAASVARLRGQDGRRFTPYELVSMATMGGARALDMEDQIGSLEVGKKADIVIVDIHAANMQPIYDPYAALVFSAYPENVRTTIVNGEIVVRDRVVKTADLEVHEREWKALTKRVAEFAKTLE
ncbi:MAG: amidohydrolase [Acidobacteria bacterium]|nr:amidohydrolase [Acidobacteriota bacterium]